MLGTYTQKQEVLAKTRLMEKQPTNAWLKCKQVISDSAMLMVRLPMAVTQSLANDTPYNIDD